MSESDDLEAALDGLIAAVNYCEEIEEYNLAAECGELYQRVAQVSPEDHWDDVPDNLTSL